MLARLQQKHVCVCALSFMSVTLLIPVPLDLAYGIDVTVFFFQCSNLFGENVKLWFLMS